MSAPRKYAFSWEHSIGNLEMARKQLGPTTRIEIYRLFQFTMRDIIEQRYGTDASDDILRSAGSLAGEEFYRHYCSDAADLNDLVRKLQGLFKEMGIGILRLEKTDETNLRFTLTVDEDLDCSGLPDTSEVICVYDEGFIQGILRGHHGTDFVVREVDCWCTGDRTCRFTADPVAS
ncbi:4-vinyl reductase [Phaeovibrio sulfidiphilus]|uniref:4-vinyl reductase n=1 Tax=Phaeovibrio sulfidiphilus TaxID=1220600 RepID=A0A8J7CW05_9PROT|nr:V4R domain-containing protein [Phaeovibrio sulfidiphilus]MBE1236946.1 4-vinyl reductase [Phaeovibrio sulfidiphilus]